VAIAEGAGGDGEGRYSVKYFACRVDKCCFWGKDFDLMIVTSLSQLDLDVHYTYSEYYEWEFDGYVELIRGKIFPLPTPWTLHQRVLGDLCIPILSHLKGKKAKGYVRPFDVRLPSYGLDGKLLADTDTVVQPDLCVFCDPAKIDKRGGNGVPDLVVEVLSTFTAKKDLNEKFNLYEEVGVKEYWVVFPDSQAINVYLLQDNRYVLRDSY